MGKDGCSNRDKCCASDCGSAMPGCVQGFEIAQVTGDNVKEAISPWGI